MGPRTHAVLARLDGVRRRARIRGRDARPRRCIAPASTGRPHTFYLKPLVVDRHLDRARARRREALRPRMPSFISGRCTGPSQRPAGGIRHDPESTRWCLCIYEAPMPKPQRRLDHAVAVPPADRGLRAGRRQGRLPLSQQCARHHRGAGARLRQLPDARHARQHRRTRHRQRLHGQGRRRLHAGPERHVPQRHHAPARHRAAARRRRDGGREDHDLCGFPGRRRDFLDRQFLQGHADHPHRRSRACARRVLPPRRAQLYWDFAHARDVATSIVPDVYAQHCRRSGQQTPVRVD